MKEINAAIEKHVKASKTQIALYAIDRMKFIILLMKVNPTLLEPESMETIMKLAEQEMEEFKQGMNTHHGLNV